MEDRNQKKNRMAAENDAVDEEILGNRCSEDTDGNGEYIKEFDGIPSEWHETIKVKNQNTKRTKLYFRCRYEGCDSVFRKSCNLRDHFRKHTAQRPYQCEVCKKNFTQSGNLGRHLKNVHSISRAVPKLEASTKFLITKEKKIKAKKA